MICKKDYDGRTLKGSNISHTGLEYDERQISVKTTHAKALEKQHLKNVESFIMKLPYRRPILLPQGSSIRILGDACEGSSGPMSFSLGLVLDDSMNRDNICQGDMLTIDRSLLPNMGDVVILKLGNYHIIGRMYWGTYFSYLIPSNPAKPIMTLLSPESYTLIGVVVGVSRTLKD